MFVNSVKVRPAIQTLHEVSICLGGRIGGEKLWIVEREVKGSAPGVLWETVSKRLDGLNGDTKGRPIAKGSKAFPIDEISAE